MGYAETMNINRLKGEIAKIEAMKDADFTALGKAFYEQIKNDDVAALPENIQPFVISVNYKNSQIAEKNNEIEAINLLLLQQQREAEAAAAAAAAAVVPQKPVVAASNFCTNCGAKLDSNMIFCVNCGKKVEKAPLEAQTVYQPSVQPNQPVQPVPTTQPTQPITYNYNINPNNNNQE